MKRGQGSDVHASTRPTAPGEKQRSSLLLSLKFGVNIPKNEMLSARPGLVAMPLIPAEASGAL